MRVYLYYYVQSYHHIFNNYVFEKSLMFYPYYIYMKQTEIRVSGFIKTERQFENLKLIVSVFKLYIKPADREYDKLRTLHIINFYFILFI